MLREQCNQSEGAEAPDTARVKALGRAAEQAHAARRAAEAAALASEREYIRAAWAATERGDRSWSDLLRVYEEVQGWGYPGFTTRWAEECPHNVHAIRRAAVAGRLPEQRTYSGEPARYGERSWTIRRGVRGQDYPPKGTGVVYRLHDADDQLIYIGSSRNLKNRIGGHSAKPWTYLTARDVIGFAPALEAVAIFTERPPLNEKQLQAWGGALSLSQAAVRGRLDTHEIRTLATRLHREVEARLDAEDDLPEDLAALFEERGQ